MMIFRQLNLILGYNGSGKTDFIRYNLDSDVSPVWVGYHHPHNGCSVSTDTSNWMRKHCEVEIKQDGPDSQFVFSDGRVEPTNTGSGFSFLLSVVHHLHLNKDSGLCSPVLVIQEPENRLHRKLQSEIGELIPHTVNKSKRLIIETNSEEVLLQTRLAVAKSVINKEDVAVYWAGNGNCSLIELNYDGSWSGPWPPWVWEQTLCISRQLIEAQREVRSKPF